MRDVVIVSGARTAIGGYMGSLSALSAVELGVAALNGAVEKAGIDKAEIQEVVCGQCNQAGSPGNTARHIAMGAGLPAESFAFTVHQQCASSMRGAELLAQEITLGKVDAGVAVGVESMTNAPYLLMGARKGYRLNDGERIQDSLMIGGLVDALLGYHMGVTAENIAERYEISREEQDEWALMSHQRAVAATEAGWFTDEILPVEIKTRKGIVTFDTDEHPRADTTLESLARLKPVFKKGGTVTAGNASGLNDAGACIVMMAADKADSLGLKPLARVVSSAPGSVEPEVMGLGVVPAVKNALRFAKMDLADMDYFEFNEAFAAQVIGCNREFGLDVERINAAGSGISLGHPVGATGVRLIVTMINQLRRRGERFGCASLCASGGPGHAFIVEAL
ncbi:acetyl-CoA acetyltransferase [Desulfatibacillum alkenivorans DSM 16219]|uniref:Acetyl-CoA acetyltransferase n=1 Tax=Desulfatibacillum alkenivorans DSM 16219 TaxID=1121393 RepID=A0A1M6MH14_9BACT|nr:thiolase family protein [Desulfatibacillum alkenivorans]SHJ82791.1 acetyl-CoA acetyltransferase [Desulfatibacillum alkenivorans DSM 16219]